MHALKAATHAKLSLHFYFIFLPEFKFYMEPVDSYWGDFIDRARLTLSLLDGGVFVRSVGHSLAGHFIPDQSEVSAQRSVSVHTFILNHHLKL